MAVIEGLEGTFDSVASTYAKLRPGYLNELYQDIFGFIPIGEASNVVEIGIGGGQATLPILQTGCTLTAVEYGEHFSEICREKFKNFPKFSVVTGKFEEVDFQEESCDLIFSASAFHWIPEEVGYRKVFSMLKKGGAFAGLPIIPSRTRGGQNWLMRYKSCIGFICPLPPGRWSIVKKCQKQGQKLHPNTVLRT